MATFEDNILNLWGFELENFCIIIIFFFKQDTAKGSRNYSKKLIKFLSIYIIINVQRVTFQVLSYAPLLSPKPYKPTTATHKTNLHFRLLY